MPSVNLEFRSSFLENILTSYQWTTLSIILAIVAIYLAFQPPLFIATLTRTDYKNIGLNACKSNPNLHDNNGNVSQGPKIAALFIYPIKSCRGIQLHESKVLSTGLKFDRMFAFARRNTQTGTWEVLTQREFSKLALIRTEIWVPRALDRGDGYLVIRLPCDRAKEWWNSRSKAITINIPLNSKERHKKAKGYKYEELSIWRDCPRSINVTNEINPEALRRLSVFLNVDAPLGLFQVDNTTLRTITRSLPKDEPWSVRNYNVGFADAFPIHMISLGSIHAVSEDLPGHVNDEENALDHRRFRANIYISGISAYEEDCWMRIRVGTAVKDDGKLEDGEYHIACRTARCVMTNVDQDSGERHRSEPHATFKKTRQVDEGAKPHPCLGLSVMPLFDRGMVSVGDSILVDRTGEHFYEKMFT